MHEHLTKNSISICDNQSIELGFSGLFNFNLVAFLFDNISVVISRIIYSIIGVAGIISIASLAIPTDED